ncbi:hypothetical protein Q4543_05130 [Salipiger sp. 1_MG-2023]|uniref:hypothetical protein n=1 Tax=Salipiger sp. 1_MG-2023 TaxID=3062665 RepID=UPI0026E189C0|nr:hypothetical protein [Salipiger sp. 1_MG-2023]MDO6584893.1 hypothetical protein [Salipiger sp. 1_MG-2023]
MRNRVTWMLALLAGLCAAPGGSVQAGAWPREKGTWFASGLVRLSWPQDRETWVSAAPSDRYSSVYVEYGPSEKITLGLDIGRPLYGTGKDIAFLRYPLRADDRPLKIAAELGFGRIEGQTVLRPGLMLGYGWKHGWLAADALAEIPVQTRAPDFKLDMTFGLNLPKDFKVMAQLQTGKPYLRAPDAKIEASLVVPIYRSLSAQLGGSWGLIEDETMGLTFGLWNEF